jgi:hypothetical protein
MGGPTTDQTRYSPAGSVSGWMQVDDERFEVEPDRWYGSRDHSWGPYHSRRPISPAGRCLATSGTRSGPVLAAHPHPGAGLDDSRSDALALRAALVAVIEAVPDSGARVRRAARDYLRGHLDREKVWDARRVHRSAALTTPRRCATRAAAAPAARSWCSVTGRATFRLHCAEPR